jgi:23S rRNA (cytidine1920-2'-O)/16S rRNA (cytidine1409-2'-O)-methyltransferase
MSYDRVILPPVDLGSSPAPEGTMTRSFVSRAGHKLEAALVAFRIVVQGRICADLGANVGGFTDCLLQFGAAKVFAVDTAYGILAWTLRKNPRVVVRERTNALHLKLPERVSLVAIDVGWTRQDRVLPVVVTLLPPATPDGPAPDVLTLVKPHYESEIAKQQRGVLTPEQSETMLWDVMDRIHAAGWAVKGIVKSPLEGQKGNVEYVAWLRRT